MLPRIFTDFTNQFDTMMVQGMDDVITSGLSEMRLQFITAMGLYVIGLGIMTAFRKMDFAEFGWAGIRAVAVSALLNLTNYNYYVRDFFFTELPNRTASAMAGPGITIQSAAQFDALWSAVMRCVAVIATASPGWLGAFDRGLANAQAGLIMFAMIVMFMVWLMSRVFMAIVICIGPYLLLTFLFSSTRTFGQQWVGKLVGLAVLQLTSSILLRFVLRTVTGRLEVLQGQMGGTGSRHLASIDMMHGTMMQITAVFWMGAMLMIVLPSVIAIGSGIGAGSAMAASQLAGAAGKLARLPMRALGR